MVHYLVHMVILTYLHSNGRAYDAHYIVTSKQS